MAVTYFFQNGAHTTKEVAHVAAVINYMRFNAKVDHAVLWDSETGEVLKTFIR